ncbi:MAG TPA: 5'-3' exonuclease H3TH domain-containing protein [Gemmatimonadales bacterium]|nr:5'-3' exonuclease H3TH domain-containing protein [Gemmatimonadales bacterium]
MRVHLLDGTYELFRHFYAMPRQTDRDGQEVAAIVGVVSSVLGMLEGGATHLGVATDHVIESFRNDLWPGYKTSEGVEPELLAQFHRLEDALRDSGVMVWAMEEFEADDALASAARLAARDPAVEQVIICTPDKDLSQCVTGDRVVQLDRRKREQRDERGVKERFGVGPASIPDYLALVGDSADGFPGVPGWGEKAASTVLAVYPHLERIPTSSASWGVPVRGAARLSSALEANRELAMLFRRLATLRDDVKVFADVNELRWRGPTPGFQHRAERLGVPGLWERARRIPLID